MNTGTCPKTRKGFEIHSSGVERPFDKREVAGANPVGSIRSVAAHFRTLQQSFKSRRPDPVERQHGNGFLDDQISLRFGVPGLWRPAISMKLRVRSLTTRKRPAFNRNYAGANPVGPLCENAA